jgi:nitroreductase
MNFLPPSSLLELMNARSHTAPKRLVAPGPSEADLQQLFLAAATAPDHGRITPWRFVLIPQESRSALGEAFVAALLSRDAQAGQEEIDRARDKAMRSPCLMLAVLKAQPQMASAEAEHPTPISINERLISLGCAIQNMLLMAHSQGWGSGITSGQALGTSAMRGLFQLEADEHAICFLNFGTVDKAKPPRQRPLPEGFVTKLSCS